ncbi:MAG: RdgB/HAM1 family non-canonical purine NTP pyrophosphatase, partial [Oscillospiraceae bacterium]
MELLIATSNKHKVLEFSRMLNPIGISLNIPQTAIDVEENGDTFEKNAFLKADAYYKLFKKPVIADDSGLVIDALNGEPGIYSARYGGLSSTKQQCNLVLEKMSGKENRSAKFVCVICYIDEKGESHFFKGECYGNIAYQEKGENGFGYDPIFTVQTKEGQKSYSQISDSQKDEISHRGIALRMLCKYFKNERK